MSAAEFKQKKIRLSASGADRWVGCPGSAWLEADIPDSTSPWAILGSAVHAAGEWAILNDIDLDPSILGGKIGYVVGGRGFIEKLVVKSPTGLPNIEAADVADGWLSSKDIEDADVYATTIRNLAEAWGVKPKIEKYISWHGTRGRVDAIFDCRDKGFIAVFDYKNGRGAVPAIGNRQMAIYLAGYLQLDKKGCDGLNGLEKITAGIIQPNGDDGLTLKAWHLEPERLLPINDELMAAADLARAMAAGETPLQFVPSAATCRWCKAKTICPALKKQALATIPEISPEKAPPTPASLSPEEMGAILEKWPLIKTWVAAVEDEALARLTRGDAVPGWKLVRGASRRRIFDEPGLIEAGEANGWEVAERKIKPFGQLDKIVPKGVLEKFTEKPEGKLIIAPEADKRPAVMAAAELMEGF